MSEQKSFIRTYVFSTDHKMIARQYLFTGLVMALIGGLLAYAFRMQLAFPSQSVPGFGVLDPGRYNTFITMHGTIMIFWVAMPVLLAAFGNYLIPLMIGADDMAFPRLNMMSYWVFLVSTLLLLASFFVPGGAFGGGWTAYPPFSATQGLAYTKEGLGVTFWILAVALEFTSVLMGGVNFLTTALNKRAPGMTLMRMPMFIWMQLIATVIFMFSVGPLIGGALMLLLDATVGTGFFIPDGGGDPVLFQHLFWFFGHPEVYVLLLPSLGIVAEVLTTGARKPLFGYKMILISVLIAGFLSFIVWAHHQFIAGIDPRLAFPFSLTTILISVPFAVAIFSFIATLWGGNTTFTPGVLFAVGMIGEFLIGGTTGIINGSSTADIYVHDTYYVVGHFHYTLFPIVIFGMFAGIYHWFPKIFGRMLNSALGKIHFWGTVVCFNSTFIPLLLLGMAGEQRRVYDPSLFPLLKPVHYLHEIATWATIGMLLFQLPFIFNFFYSLFKGRTAEANPWKSNTLEWVAPSPPPHGNFEEMPVVYRGPYEYSVPNQERDWLPQNAAPTEGGA